MTIKTKEIGNRKIFYINTGTLSKEKVEQHLQKIILEYKDKK